MVMRIPPTFVPYPVCGWRSDFSVPRTSTSRPSCFCFISFSRSFLPVRRKVKPLRSGVEESSAPTSVASSAAPRRQPLSTTGSPFFGMPVCSLGLSCAASGDESARHRTALNSVRMDFIVRLGLGLVPVRRASRLMNPSRSSENDKGQASIYEFQPKRRLRFYRSPFPCRRTSQQPLASGVSIRQQPDARDPRALLDRVDDRHLLGRRPRRSRCTPGRACDCRRG